MDILIHAKLGAFFFITVIECNANFSCCHTDIFIGYEGARIERFLRG